MVPSHSSFVHPAKNNSEGKFDFYRWERQSRGPIRGNRDVDETSERIHRANEGPRRSETSVPDRNVGWSIVDGQKPKEDIFFHWQSWSVQRRKSCQCLFPTTRTPFFRDGKPREKRARGRGRLWSTVARWNGKVSRESWALVLGLRTWCFAVVREVLDEQSSPVHRVNFTADAVMKFRQLANKLSVISCAAAYLCKQNRIRLISEGGNWWKRGSRGIRF